MGLSSVCVTVVWPLGRILGVWSVHPQRGGVCCCPQLWPAAAHGCSQPGLWGHTQQDSRGGFRAWKGSASLASRVGTPY